MNNILDYVKPLVEEIYSREPNFDNDIIVELNKIIIKKTGRFPGVETIRLTRDGLFNIVADYEGWINNVDRRTIKQVVDFILD